MTGINTVIFYSTTIFKMAGVQNAFLGTVLVGVLNVLMTMVSGYMVDKAGTSLARMPTITWSTRCCVCGRCVGACVLHHYGQ
jgi:hypothetical protein